MIKFFRKIRKNMIKDLPADKAGNRVSKYLLYAIGEIVLVVIGILIALQINNNNEANKERAKELHYLKNIKTDLLLNINNFIETRETKIISANIVLEYYEGKPLTDLNDFSNNLLNIYIWHKFYQNNNTFLELTNSGNLALISNDSIKNSLLNIDAIYKELKGEEEHYRFDTEVLLYEPSFSALDLNPLTKKYMYDVSNGQAGENRELPRENFETLLKDIKHKNGFVMAVYEFTVMNGQLATMKNMSLELIKLIDNELKKDN